MTKDHLARSWGFQQTWFEPNRTTRSWATTKHVKEKNKKKGDLREKDFYKYNKAMPKANDRSPQSVDEEDNKGRTLNFSNKTQELAENPKGKGKEDCGIS